MMTSSLTIQTAMPGEGDSGRLGAISLRFDVPGW